MRSCRAYIDDFITLSTQYQEVDKNIDKQEGQRAKTTRFIYDPTTLPVQVPSQTSLVYPVILLY